MISKTNSKQNLILLAFMATIIVTLVAGRLGAHNSNFTPTIALALVAGYLFRNKALAIATILIGMIISDLFIGFDSLNMRLVVYGALFLSVLIGGFLPKSSSNISKKSESIFTVSAIASTFAGAILFFLISNVAVWAWSGMYILDFSGLLQSYTNAVPFFRNSLTATTLFGALFLGAARIAELTILNQETNTEVVPIKIQK